MKDIFEKLGTYNLFNYLFPGALFAYLADLYLKINIMQKDIIIAAFLYYFIGLVVSRIGSILIEPILKKIKFVAFADYKKFVELSKEDTKLEVLSETNNMYRTLLALFFILIISKIFIEISNKVEFIKTNEITIIILFLIMLFLFAYRKQTSYISKRVNKQ